MFGDIQSPRLLYSKAALLVALGVFAAVLLMWGGFEHPSWSTAALLVISTWAFCRAYYFAFYVVEKYVDSKYRFAGLVDFARYVFKRGNSGN